jgi:hypothetical protein
MGNPKNVKNGGWDFFFLTYAKLFHFGDENLACEHELNEENLTYKST